MQLAGAARLFAYKAIWRLTGLPAAGRALVRALGTDDSDLRTIAGMFLVQAGKRAEPFLHEALVRREHLPMVLGLLGDIGAREVEPAIRQLTHDPDPDIAQAAQKTLRILRAGHDPSVETGR